MRKNIISGIYCIENMTTNKKYIGQSRNIDDRWYKHKNKLRNKKHENDYLQKAWNKYGEDDFKFYIIEECDIEKLDEREIYYIDFYNVLNHDYGYNMQSGGQSSCLTEYARAKLSASIKKAYQNENLRKQRSIDALNQWANPEIKKKITGKNNGMYGRKHSKETRRKMSENKIKKPSPKRNTTPVLCIELNRVFQDAVTACTELGLNKSSTGSIFSVCKGERRTCGGYHWKFLLENNI